MKKILQLISLLFLLIFTSACVQGNKENIQVDPSLKPTWIDYPQNNPKVEGKYFGVGSARTHIRGKRQQRLLAISSAINEIAQQKGVKVDNSLERIKTISGARSKSASKMYSKQTVNGKLIDAQIVEIWKDPSNNELYILMSSE